MAEATASAKTLIQKAIQSNLLIQEALTTQATQLEAQLKELDELIEGVKRAVTSEEVPDVPLEGEFQIPGSKRASGPIPSFELLSQESPFYREASQRAHYLRWTSVRPIKGKEAEVLADAVKKENMRLEAYRARDDPTAPLIDIVHNVQGIDWSIVAEKVSDQSNTKRTPDECRIQWVGNLHPKVNHGVWTQDELERLHDLTANELAQGGKTNWARVAKDLGTNRIPIDCMKQATTKPRHHWDSLNDQKLREAVQLFGTNNWNLVARHVSPYATTSQCQTRYVRSVDPDIKRGPWSPEEDDRLRKAVAAFSNSWIDVAGVLPGRTNEQCRERWGEISANRGGKGDWSPEEDQMLLNLVKELGNKWKAIGVKIGSGRTGPHCRIRYDKLIRMQAKQAEGETAAVTFVAGPSQVPSPAIQTVPPSATSREANIPVPVDVQPKAQQGRQAKAAEVLLEGGAPTALVQDASTSIQPPSQGPIPVAVCLKPRPRPRPRPAYKGKEKEKAVDGNIPGERMDPPEQSWASSGQPLVPPEISSLVTSGQPPVQIQQSITQAKSTETADSSNVGLWPVTRPEAGDSMAVAPPPPLSVSREDRKHIREESTTTEASTTSRDEREEEQRETGKRKRGDTNDTGVVNEPITPDESPSQRSQRKKRKVPASSDTDSEPKTGSSKVQIDQQQTEGKGLVSVDNVCENIAEGYPLRSAKRGRSRGGGRRRGRARGRGGGLASAMGGGSATSQKDAGQDSAKGGQTDSDVLEFALAPPPDPEGELAICTNLAEREGAEDYGSRRGRGRGTGRGRGRGRGRDSVTSSESQPLRRSSRTASV